MIADFTPLRPIWVAVYVIQEHLQSGNAPHDIFHPHSDKNVTDTIRQQERSSQCLTRPVPHPHEDHLCPDLKDLLRIAVGGSISDNLLCSRERLNTFDVINKAPPVLCYHSIV